MTSHGVGSVSKRRGSREVSVNTFSPSCERDRYQMINLGNAVLTTGMHVCMYVCMYGRAGDVITIFQYVMVGDHSRGKPE